MRPRRTTTTLLIALVLATSAFATRDPVQEALASITTSGIRAHLRFLSHDFLEGRAPGTRGAELAALYIASQFARAGVEPVRGSHYQRVPLTGVTPDPERVSLAFQRDGRRLAADYLEDVVLWPGRPDTLVAVSGELVFVGYGVHAPEYDWDDFKGRDVRGKVLLVLVNDPPAPPDEPGLFGGRELTYYGRWTYKLEEAARRGAAGVLLVHTEESAGYPWGVVRASWAGEQLALAARAGAREEVALQGWLTRSFTRRLLESAGLSLEELVVGAARRDFRPVSLGTEARARIHSSVRALESSNVVGQVRGSDPALRDQIVVYTAHYDHLGIGPPVAGDSIYNGAYDNASGVAVLLEMAGAFARLEPRPARTVLFIATTAEEAGLLGAEHYARNPLYPLRSTLAVLNVDGANLWGETDDMTVLGAGRSTLGAVAAARAEELGLTLSPERSPELGFFFRSDHFPFARAGVPAIKVEHGIRFTGRPAGWGEERLARWDADNYHRPSDRFDSAFDLTGAVQQARFAFLIGYDVALAEEVPRWVEGAEFRRR